LSVRCAQGKGGERGEIGSEVNIWLAYQHPKRRVAMCGDRAETWNSDNAIRSNL
jgi:hypothetical protein